MAVALVQVAALHAVAALTKAVVVVVCTHLRVAPHTERIGCVHERRSGVSGSTGNSSSDAVGSAVGAVAGAIVDATTATVTVAVHEEWRREASVVRHGDATTNSTSAPPVCTRVCTRAVASGAPCAA
jgi:hypothetical protein